MLPTSVIFCVLQQWTLFHFREIFLLDLESAPENAGKYCQTIGKFPVIIEIKSHSV